MAEYLSDVEGSLVLTGVEREAFASVRARYAESGARTRSIPPIEEALGAAVTSGVLTPADAGVLRTFVNDVVGGAGAPSHIGVVYAGSDAVESMSEAGLAAFSALRLTFESLAPAHAAVTQSSSLRFGFDLLAAQAPQQANDIETRCRGYGYDPPPIWTSCIDWGATYGAAAAAGLAAGAIGCGALGPGCLTPQGGAGMGLLILSAGVATAGSTMFINSRQVEQAREIWCRDRNNRSHPDWHDTCYNG